MLRAAIQLAAYARGVPKRLDSKLVERTPVADLAERAIAIREQATAQTQSIGWNIDTVSAKFPWMRNIAKLPFEFAVFRSRTT